MSDYGPTRAHYSAHVGGPAPRSTVDSLGAPSLVRDEAVVSRTDSNAESNPSRHQGRGPDHLARLHARARRWWMPADYLPGPTDQGDQDLESRSHSGSQIAQPTSYDHGSPRSADRGSGREGRPADQSGRLVETYGSEKAGAPGTGLSTKAVRGVRGPELRRPSAHVHAPINAQPMVLLRSPGAKGVRAPNLDPMWAQRPQLTITERFYATCASTYTVAGGAHTDPRQSHVNLTDELRYNATAGQSRTAQDCASAAIR